MVSDELIDALNATVFWPRLMADPELQLVHNHNKLSIAYGTYDLLSDFRLVDGELACQSERQALPDRTNPIYFELDCRPRLGHRVDDSGRLRLAPLPEPIEFFDASSERLDAYKAARSASASCGRRHRHVIAFGVNQDNRIVACRCGRNTNGAYDYVVLRGEERIATPVSLRSMREPWPAPTPSNVVASAMTLSRIWAREEGHTLKDLNTTLTLRRRLGAATALQDTDGPVVRMADRPVIAIGDCSEGEIAMISERRGRWAMLTEEGLDRRCEVIPFWRTLRL